MRSAALVLVLAWPGVAWPQAEPVAAPPAPPPEESTWVDTSHRFLSEGFLWAVVRFDRFFADQRDVDLPRTSSFVHFRNVIALHDDGRRAYAPDVRVELVLPNLDRRIDQLQPRLAFATTRPAVVDPLLPPALRPLDVPNRPYAALVLRPVRKLAAKTDLQAGVLIRPLGVFARARFRHVQPIGGVMVARLALVGFWQPDLRLGTRQVLSLEHPFTSWLLLRLSGNSMVAQRSRGWEWSSELALLAGAGPSTALSASVAAFGATRARTGAEAYRIQVRARHAVLRPWIFLEVDPELVWTRAAAPRLHRAGAVIVRLELQFEASSGPSPGESAGAVPHPASPGSGP